MVVVVMEVVVVIMMMAMAMTGITIMIMSQEKVASLLACLTIIYSFNYLFNLFNSKRSPGQPWSWHVQTLTSLAKRGKTDTIRSMDRQYGVWTDKQTQYGVWTLDRQTDTKWSMDRQTDTIWTLSIGQTKRNNADRRTDTTQSQNLYQEYIDAF